MNSIALFAIVLAVAGGFIAWLGDWLGTKVGKKRMTFWKLRPRHTAMLYTIVSGGLISLLTLTVLIVSDNAFKRALLEGPRLVLQNENYKQQIKDKEAKARADERRAAEKARQLEAMQRQLAPVQQSLDQKQKQLAGMKVALADAQTQIRDAHRQVQIEQGNVLAAQRNVLAAQRQVAGVKGQVRDLQTKRRQLITLNQGLTNYANLLSNKVENSSSGNLIYHKDEEVGRAVITTRQTARVIQMELSRFLHDLGREAVQRGSWEKGRAVVVGPPRLESAALQALSQNIAAEAGKTRSVVVIARARGNTFKGEIVAVELKPYDNVFIYRKSAVVASQVIDGTQSEAQILSALQVFFTRRVRAAVLDHGLIPQTDPATGAPVVGAIDGRTTLTLRNKIQQIGADAQVTAYAGVNTYSSGPVPMVLDFEVTHALPNQARPASAAGGGP